MGGMLTSNIETRSAPIWAKIESISFLQTEKFIPGKMRVKLVIPFRTVTLSYVLARNIGKYTLICQTFCL